MRRRLLRVIGFVLLAAILLSLAAGCSRGGGLGGASGSAKGASGSGLAPALGGALGLAREQDEGVRFLIGVSQPNQIEPWRVKMNEEISAEAALHDDVRLIFSDANQSSAKQIEDIRKMMLQGIDLLIVSPNNEAFLTSTISEVHRSIPVIVVDRAIEGSGYTLFIGPDNAEIGMQAGQLVTDLVGGGEGRIIEIQGLYGSPSARDRSLGFNQAIAGRSNLQIVRTVFADWFTDRAEDRVYRILKESPDANVIVAQNDSMAYGAYKAAARLGLEKRMRFFGIDGLSGPEGGLELVRAGILTGTFACSTGASEALGYAIRILNQSPDIPKKVILRSDLVTAVNAAELVRKRNAASGHPAIDPKSVTVGFVHAGHLARQPSVRDSDIAAEIRAAGMKLVQRDANGNQAAQVEAVREFIRSRVDAIVLDPVAETGWEPVLQEARAAGIPVVLVGQSVLVRDRSLYTAWIGSDFHDQGRKAGEWLAGRLKGSDTVMVAELAGRDSAASASGLSAGFADALQGHGRFQVMRMAAGEDSRAAGRAAMTALFDGTASLARATGSGDAAKSSGANGSGATGSGATGPIAAVYCHSDELTLGALEAIEAHGLRPGRDIIVVAADAGQDALAEERRSRVNAAVAGSLPFGRQVASLLLAQLSGQPAPLRVYVADGEMVAQTVED